MPSGLTNPKTEKTEKLRWRISFVLVHASVMNHLTLLTLLVFAAPFGWGDPSQVDDGEVDVAVYSPPVLLKGLTQSIQAKRCPEASKAR